jgi:hypothetical protein
MKPAPPDLLIRTAVPSDAPALGRLAALDEAPLPGGQLLVAEVAGELWAAVSLDTLEAIADPFHPTAGVIALVQMRAGQLRISAASPRRRWWRRGATRLPGEVVA